MKDLIRQILREELSWFDKKYDENTINLLYEFMDFTTTGFFWYRDSPKKRFEYSPNSVWLINPDTREWMYELKRNGEVIYNPKFEDLFNDFFDFTNAHAVYLVVSRRWITKTLKRNAKTMIKRRWGSDLRVTDVLENGRKSK